MLGPLLPVLAQPQRGTINCKLRLTEILSGIRTEYKEYILEGNFKTPDGGSLIQLGVYLPDIISNNEIRGPLYRLRFESSDHKVGQDSMIPDPPVGIIVSHSSNLHPFPSPSAVNKYMQTSENWS